MARVDGSLPQSLDRLLDIAKATANTVEREVALTPQGQAGYDLFRGKAQCNACDRNGGGVPALMGYRSEREVGRGRAIKSVVTSGLLHRRGPRGGSQREPRK